MKSIRRQDLFPSWGSPMFRLVMLSLLSALLAGCQAIPFQIRKNDVGTDASGRMVMVLDSQLDLVAMTRGRAVQFRCYMVLSGVTNEDIMAFGAIYADGQNIRNLNESKTKRGKMEWFSYSARLNGDDFMDNQNNRYRLSDPQLAKLRCQVVGVTKSPAPFYVSNFVDVLPSELTKGLPNHTSDGIRQPANGSSKPSM